MTTSTDPSAALILLDTNLLLRLRNTSDPDHAIRRQALEVAEGRSLRPAIAAQVLMEFWVVATRPKSVNGLGFEPDDVARDLRTFLDTLTFLPDPRDLFDRWLHLVTRERVCGRPGHDARIVGLMEAHGVRTLLTLNPGDFKRFPTITALTPSEFVASGATT
jgi:predicted nucleic acid-binding protein